MNCLVSSSHSSRSQYYISIGLGHFLAAVSIIAVLLVKTEIPVYIVMTRFWLVILVFYVNAARVGYRIERAEWQSNKK